MNHLEKTQSAKKEVQNRSMKQNTQGTDKNRIVVIKQKGGLVLKWLVTATYLVLLIYFVLKPLTEFFMMIEYYIEVNILNFLFP